MVILSTLGVLGARGGLEAGTLLGVWMRAVFKNYSLGQGIDGGLERIQTTATVVDTVKKG